MFGKDKNTVAMKRPHRVEGTPVFEIIGEEFE